MEFNPNNDIVRICLQGMSMEENGNPEEARRLFLQAWDKATNNFEKYMAAFYVARHQNNITDKLKWLEISLEFAHHVNNDSVTGAFVLLYSSIAQCFTELNDFDNAKKYHDLASKFTDKPTDKGPFYHGTKADLRIGDLLTAGGESNFKSKLVMNHIYFTALVNGAGLASELANGNGNPRVYIVEPTGDFENDPNVTNKKFPGNPTRSYRSHDPLRIIGEVTDWVRLTPDELRKWHEKLANTKGKIIN